MIYRYDGFDRAGVTMDGATSRKMHYRPIFKSLRIGSKEYAVLDQDLAHERAIFFLSEAIGLLESDEPEFHAELINQYLLTACDFGSKDAAFLLACRALEPAARLPYPAQDAVVFLKLAAVRNHAEAAYQLACCYAAMGKFLPTEQGCTAYFNGIDPRERQRLAEQYFAIAIENDHAEAIEDIIIAYAYGRGYLTKSPEKFTETCEKLMQKDCQTVALGYGAWLSGMTVDGNDPLPEAVKIPLDYTKALECFFKCSRGKHLELAQHSLHLICLGMARGIWNIKQTDKLQKMILRELNTGNQLLSLYCAWFSIPAQERCELPAIMNNYQLTALAAFIEPDTEKALQYLDTAFFGEHEVISAVAKEIMREVFGQRTVAQEVIS